MSSLIGKPLRKFVREGLDIKVCIIRDRAIPCPDSVKLIDVDEEHVIQVVQAKARDYKREVKKQIYVPKIKIGAEVKVPEVENKELSKEDEMVNGVNNDDKEVEVVVNVEDESRPAESKEGVNNNDKEVEVVVNVEDESRSSESKETHTPEGGGRRDIGSWGNSVVPAMPKKVRPSNVESLLGNLGASQYTEGMQIPYGENVVADESDLMTIHDEKMRQRGGESRDMMDEDTGT
ncbi:hypothetical protein LINPERPRIM_LOCUS6353 [Linum perenne]